MSNNNTFRSDEYRYKCYKSQSYDLCIDSILKMNPYFSQMNDKQEAERIIVSVLHELIDDCLTTGCWAQSAGFRVERNDSIPGMYCVKLFLCMDVLCLKV